MIPIERVARAICEARGHLPDAVDPRDLSHKRLAMWRRYVPAALAAIEAMREPSESMSIAGGECKPFMYETELCKNRPGRIIASTVWTAMIEAALSER